MVDVLFLTYYYLMMQTPVECEESQIGATLYEGVSQRDRYDAGRAHQARFKLDHMARLEHDYKRNETNPCGKSDA